MKKRIFFDMDGVLAKWDTQASIEEVASPGYFIAREADKNAVDAFCKIAKSKKYEIFILSSVFQDDHSIKEKIEWLKSNGLGKYLDQSHMLFSVYGKSKSDIVPGERKDDILIDDFSNNLKSWHGIGIKYLNGINATKGTWKGFTVSGNSNPSYIAATITAIADMGKTA